MDNNNKNKVLTPSGGIIAPKEHIRITSKTKLNTMAISTTYKIRFGRYILQPSSGVCQTQEPSRNFKLHPLLNPRESPVLIAVTRYKC